MRLQLASDLDQKLNKAIKDDPNMLDDLIDQYHVTDRTIESLVDILANKYRSILNAE